MGKGEEIAVALGQLAHMFVHLYLVHFFDSFTPHMYVNVINSIKPLIPEVKQITIEGDNQRVEGKGDEKKALDTVDETAELYERLLTAIRIIEVHYHSIHFGLTFIRNHDDDLQMVDRIWKG
jgi:hypothetical protein